MGGTISELYRFGKTMVKCPYPHPTNLPLVYFPHQQLADGSRRIIQPCDIMFWHGHSALNKSIQFFVDFPINHVSMFVGGKKSNYVYTYNTFHSIGSGVCIQDMRDAWSDSDQYILVYRYYGNVQGLTFQQKDRIIHEANEYYKANTKYGVLELPQIALRNTLLGSGKVNLATRKAFDSMVGLANNLIEGGKEIVTCGELIDRCYAEAQEPIGLLPDDFERTFDETDEERMRLIPALCYDYEKDFGTPEDLMRSPKLKRIGMLVRPDA